VTPAELTWRSGVDVLSFGASKNGALAVEAILVFDPSRAASLGFRRKRAGHLFSKMRVLAAQLEAYLTDDLWLRHARHANAMAQRLAEGLRGIAGVRLCHPVEANEVFAELPERLIQALYAEGFQFYRWMDDRSTTVRLVTAFNTRLQDIEALVAAVKHHAGIRTAAAATRVVE
jgi:threonine aldolase